MTPSRTLAEADAESYEPPQWRGTWPDFDTLALMMAQVPLAAADVAVWIHVSIDEKAGSGEGARGTGGLFNPPNSCPVVYGALDVATAGAEFRRLAHRHRIGMQRLLPRHLLRFRLRSSEVLDLRQPAVRTAIALPADGLYGVPTDYKQLIGMVAFHLQIGTIIATSATRIGDIVAVFPELNPEPMTSLEYMKIWRTPADIPDARMTGGGWDCPVPGQAL